MNNIYYIISKFRKGVYYYAVSWLINDINVTDTINRANYNQKHV
jgi:hypothetical protein